MIEPRPLTVAKEELENKEIRVGIILKEDSLTDISCSTGTSRLSIQGSLELPPHSEFRIFVKDSGISIEHESKTHHFQQNEKVLLTPISPTPLETTLTINPIVAGRSFHWKKKITAHFPGSFELSVKDSVFQMVNILSFEHYLACVVVSEMSSGTPPEFVKAQTIAARSWARCFLNEKHPGEDFELCNDDDCQRYHGVTFADQASLQASRETLGEYLFDSSGNVVPAYYSKSCGGMTDDPEATFGFAIPGIRAVMDGKCEHAPNDLNRWLNLTNEESKELYCAGPKEELEQILGGVDDAGEYFRWEHRESKEALARYLNEQMGNSAATVVTKLSPKKRGPSGRIHELFIEFKDQQGKEGTYTCTSQYEIRATLHPSFLYSSAFDITDEGETFLFRGAGWGHGVGLCQIGGTFQAIKGRNYQEILKLYFPDTTLEKCYHEAEE